MDVNLARKKGKEGEAKFKKWLEEHNIPFMYFDQKIESYSKEFFNKLKRPDFMILIPNFGFILVDVKCYTIHTDAKGKYINLDEKEVREYIELHEEFGVPIWFSISNEKCQFHSWYWISASQLNKKNIEINKGQYGNKYFKVRLDSFIELKWNDGLEKLFTNKK